MRLGIIGGTFDPIHYGHLFIAEEARARFQLNHVAFIPNGQPPHKNGAVVSPARHRYAMTQTAVAGNPNFICSPIEMQRPGLSYTVDTLTTLKEMYPDAELFYITGVDAIAQILTWKRHEEVFRLATFLAATRPGFDLLSLKDALPQDYLARVLLIGSTYLGISSTDIRDRVRQNLPARYLTPDSVLNYIYKNQLYKAGGAEIVSIPEEKPEKNA